ncbi:MAG: spore coat protein [Spirochaetaceae bacterium]|jgi:spore coat polysaccharide biosynthesis protein SpsF|nr:spore coat protein [Spirochaetaceae bacterium]
MTALILQARLDSTRLPQKALLPLGGRPLLLRVMEALNRIPAEARILACPADCAETFEPLAGEAGFALYAGSKEDVLARYCGALRHFFLKVSPAPGEDGLPDRVIRATGDNPFVFADAALRIHDEATALGADYAGYAGLPYGAGVESLETYALLQAEREAREQAEREHVAPYLYKHPEYFRLHRPLAPRPWQAPLRLTVDTEEDYRRAERLYALLDERCGPGNPARWRGETIIEACKDLGTGYGIG